DFHVTGVQTCALPIFDEDYAYAQSLFVDYDKAWDEFLKLPRDEVGERMVQDILEKRRIADESTAKLDGFMKTGDFDAAIDVLLNELRPRAVAWNQAIAKLAKRQDELSLQSREAYLEVEARTRELVLAFGALSIVLGALAAYLITRSLTIPLTDAVRVADGIADGRLDNQIDTRGRDEPAVLARSMQRMQQQVQAVIAAQRELAGQHEAGTISY